MVIEKRQRPIRRERRQPQRHSRELHRRRIQIDAVQASFRDLAAQRRAIGSADIGGRPTAIANQRLLAASARNTHAATRNAPLPIAGSTTRSSRISSAVRPSTSGVSVRRTRNSVSACGV